LHKNFLRKALRLKREAEGIAPKRKKSAPKPQFKSVRARQNYVRCASVTEGQPRVPVIIECEICCDMPWARGEDRHDGNWVPNGYTGPDGIVRCRGCHEPREAEPRPEPMSVLRSNCGMAANHGYLFGDAQRCENRASRAKVKSND